MNVATAYAYANLNYPNHEARSALPHAPVRPDRAEGRHPTVAARRVFAGALFKAARVIHPA